jgi:hypothetical protein
VLAAVSGAVGDDCTQTELRLDGFLDDFLEPQIRGEGRQTAAPDDRGDDPPPAGPATALCGNGICEGGEDGASCGQDCCDARTACDQTLRNEGTFYCRSMNDTPYAWWTVAQVTVLCDGDEDVCVSTYACGGEVGSCQDTPNGWAAGSCR